MEDTYSILSAGVTPGSLHLDLAYSSRNASVEFLAACNTSLGFGWAHTYSTFLFMQQGVMYRRDAQGGIVKFDRQPNTSPVLYKPTAGLFETLIGNTNGTFTIRYLDGTTEQFSNFPACPYFCKSPIYQLTGRTDRNGNKITLAYDAAGRLATVTDPYGRALTFTYDANNRVQTVSDALGRVTQFAYSAFGAALLQITDPLGATVQYQYDAEYRATQKTHKNGSLSFYTYSNGLVVAAYLKADGTRVFLGSVANTNNWALDATLLADQLITRYLPSSVTYLDANSNSWVYTYDTNDYPVTFVPPGQTSGRSLVFDPATLRPVAETDANGNSIYRAYDAVGNLLAETNCLGQVTRYTYETNFNQVTSLTDPNGFVTTNFYDGHGNLIEQTDPLGFSRYWTYDARGNVLTEQDKNGNVTAHYYDQFGHCTNTTDALGHVTTFSFDALGNLISRTDPNLHMSTYTYDAMNHLVATTNGLTASDPAPGPLSVGVPQLSVAAQGDGSLLFQWTGAGAILTHTRDLTQPFEDVLAGGMPVTNSPFQISAPLTNACEFYRLRSTTETPAGGLPFGPLSDETPPNSKMTIYAYDAEGNLTTITDANGNTTRYAYDERNRLIHATNALGGVSSSTYDETGNKLTDTDANGHTTWYAYDDQSRLAYITNSLGNVTSFAFDLVGNQIATIDANGHETMFAYDCLNRVIAVTNALGYVTQVNYDSTTGSGGCGCGSGTLGTSLIAKLTDANGKVSYFKYDALGRMLKFIRKQGDPADVITTNDAVTSFAYDPEGNRLIAVDPNGLTNAFGYDALNRQIAATNGAGDVMLTAYDPVGNFLTVTLPNGNIVTNYYDALDRLIQENDSLGRVASYTYDNVGNRTSATDGNTNTTLYCYDPLNRPVATTDPMAHSFTNIYDPVGNLLTTVDRNGNLTGYAYDALNRRIGVTNALGNVTTYAYDPMGVLRRLTDGNTNSTSFTYDAVNRLIQKIYPDTSTDAITYTYDGMGNLTSRTDQNRNTTFYKYNDLYYLTNRSYANDPADRFVYDLGGRLLMAAKTNWLTSMDWAVTFAYDGANRLTNTVQGGQAIAYTYNIPGRSRTLSYSSGRLISETVDARGKLLTVSDGGPVPVASYAYDPGNRVQTFAYRNGAMASYGYNPNGWITSLIQSNASSLLAGFAYDYDRESNKQAEHDLSLLANSEYYNYDAVYQLTNYQAGAGLQPIQETWNFDPLGNWNFTTTNGLLETRTHNAANEIVSLNSNSIAYDWTGNLTNDSQLACEYDQENRLVSVRPALPVNGSLRGDYAYDCFGRRIGKTIYVWSTNQWNLVSNAQFYYDRWLLISRVVGSLLPTSTNDYIWGMDISGTPQGAGGIGGLLCSVESSNYYYYVYDGRGNIRKVLDEGQNTVATYDYVAFGGERTHVGAYADSNPFRFSTKYCDDETGLMYFGGRHYNPRLGRWMSRDPIGEAGGMNLYEFVQNAPICRIDPLGFDDCQNYSVTSIGFGSSGDLGPLGWNVSGNLEISKKKCKVCCAAGTKNAGQWVTDYEISISITGSATVSASTAGGGFSIAGYKASWWAGLQVSLGYSGSASGTLKSDLCNNIPLSGEVCFSGGGTGSISGGFGVSVQWGWFQLSAGGDVTGTGSFSIKKCYTCNGTSCSWGQSKFCLSGTVKLNLNAVFFSGSLIVFSGEKCGSL